MAAKDIYHTHVINALVKDGWTVTDDPLTITIGRKDLQVDLGAERIVGAERNNERIAVEVKSFVSASAVQDLKEALGQFILYEEVLAQTSDADRILFLAIRQSTYDEIFTEPIGEILITHRRLRLLVFNEFSEEITQWIQ
jgi:XisH protein